MAREVKSVACEARGLYAFGGKPVVWSKFDDARATTSWCVINFWWCMSNKKLAR